MANLKEIILTTDQAAELSGVSERRIRQLCETGAVEALKLKRDWAVSKESFEAWMKKREG